MLSKLKEVTPKQYCGLAVLLGAMFVITDGNIGLMFLMLSSMFFAYKWQKTLDALNSTKEALSHYKNLSTIYEEQLQENKNTP